MIIGEKWAMEKLRAVVGEMKLQKPGISRYEK